jgi:hypothetical protein
VLAGAGLVEERFPIRHPYHSYDFFVGDELEYLVDEKERIAVWKYLFDIDSVEDGTHDYCLSVLAPSVAVKTRKYW